jgi:hypothetical protein
MMAVHFVDLRRYLCFSGAGITLLKAARPGGLFLFQPSVRLVVRSMSKIPV